MHYSIVACQRRRSVPHAVSLVHVNNLGLMTAWRSLEQRQRMKYKFWCISLMSSPQASIFICLPAYLSYHIPSFSFIEPSTQPLASNPLNVMLFSYLVPALFFNVRSFWWVLLQSRGASLRCFTPIVLTRYYRLQATVYQNVSPQFTRATTIAFYDCPLAYFWESRKMLRTFIHPLDYLGTPKIYLHFVVRHIDSDW